MIQYTLKTNFDLPSEEELVKIFLHFANGSFKYSFWKGIAPPNRVEIEISGLSAAGVKEVQNQFRQFNITGGQFTTIETYG